MSLLHAAGASARFGFPFCVRYLASISPSWSALLLFCGSSEARWAGVGLHTSRLFCRSNPLPVRSCLFYWMQALQPLWIISRDLFASMHPRAWVVDLLQDRVDWTHLRQPLQDAIGLICAPGPPVEVGDQSWFVFCHITCLYLASLRPNPRMAFS